MSRISVVIATYNGEKYILEQLKSILSQTQTPNEVLIMDDKSNDKTCNLIADFILDNKLSKSWKLIKNEYNKGFIKNFLDGIKLSTGDIIFFSDQDDIWNNKKIELMVEIIQKENAEAVVCLSNSINSDGIVIPNQTDRFKRLRTSYYVNKISINQRLKFSISSGLCLAFKKDIFPEVEKLSTRYQLPHDLSVGLISTIHHKYYQINKVLVSHRVHTNNVSQTKTKLMNSIRDEKRQIASRQIKYRELLGIKNLYWNQLTQDEQEELTEAIYLTKQAIIGLKDRKIKKLLPLLYTRNVMLNRLLAIRNILSLIRNKILC